MHLIERSAGNSSPSNEWYKAYAREEFREGKTIVFSKSPGQPRDRGKDSKKRNHGREKDHAHDDGRSAFDLVAWKRIWIMGKPVFVPVAAATSPIQKRTVIRKASARVVLRTTASIMAAGTFLGASVISSLRWRTPSKPVLISHEFLEVREAAPVSTEVIERSPCLLYTSPSPRDRTRSRMPSSA